MGKILVEKMLPSLSKMTWPENPEATPLGRRAYEIGLDKVDEYSGDPKTLASALRTFQTGESRPYAFAGVAFTLVRASREKEGSYSQLGLNAALEWLELAQELAPDVVEINMIEAYIYIYGGRYNDARLILDYLTDIDPANYFVRAAEMVYWREQGNLDNMIHWFEEASAVAETVPRKLRLRIALADAYLAFGRDDAALNVYQESVHFARENPQLWHKMSLAYWRKEEFEEADRCNKKALALQNDYPEAQKMQEALKDKLDTGGFARRLFGR